MDYGWICQQQTGYSGCYGRDQEGPGRCKLLFFITHPLAKSSMNELRVKEMKEEKVMGLFFFQGGCELNLWPEQVQMIDLCSVIWTYSCLVCAQVTDVANVFFRFPLWMTKWEELLEMLRKVKTPLLVIKASCFEQPTWKLVRFWTGDDLES